MSKNRRQAPPYTISQNFLTSRATIERLLRKTDLTGQDTVLEIGAGKGHITKALSARCRQVIAYEIDPKLAINLKPRLAGNVTLHGTDFLKAALPQEPYRVFANIPFSRTTDIVRKLTSATNPPDGVWLVMEKGAAKRFGGFPHETRQSLLLKPFFEPRIVYHFRRDDFHPAPSVDTVLFELKRRRTPDIPPAQRKNYATFLSHGMKYGLFHARALLTPKQIATALRLAGLPQIERTGDIRYIQWLCLFRCWLRYGGK